jgi:hypothetical protein
MVSIKVRLYFLIRKALTSKSLRCMQLYIQNMVCLCCRMTVATELAKLDLQFTNLKLGEVSLEEPITTNQRTQLGDALHVYGLELMDDEKEILVEKIVTVIVKMIHETDKVPVTNFSMYLTNQLNQDYHSLAALFSKTKGITIEHFIILHKIERAKELITYDELSLTEIAFKLNTVA